MTRKETKKQGRKSFTTLAMKNKNFSCDKYTLPSPKYSVFLYTVFPLLFSPSTGLHQGEGAGGRQGQRERSRLRGHADQYADADAAPHRDRLPHTAGQMHVRKLVFMLSLSLSLSLSL